MIQKKKNKIDDKIKKKKYLNANEKKENRNGEFN